VRLTAYEYFLNLSGTPSQSSSSFLASQLALRESMTHLKVVSIVVKQVLATEQTAASNL
jgi:hypothetical protein